MYFLFALRSEVKSTISREQLERDHGDSWQAGWHRWCRASRKIRFRFGLKATPVQVDVCD